MGLFALSKVVHATASLDHSEVKNIEVWPSIVSPSFVENIDVFFRTHHRERENTICS